MNSNPDGAGGISHDGRAECCSGSQRFTGDACGVPFVTGTFNLTLHAASLPGVRTISHGPGDNGTGGSGAVPHFGTVRR